MSSRFVKSASITVLLMLLSTFLHFPGLVEASMSVSAESDAAAALVEAEERIVVCYYAVAEADQVGANVAALLTRLNEAGWCLSEAQWAYEMSDFDSANYHVLLSQELLEGFVAEAEILKQTALEARYWDFMVNVVGSIIGTLLVICSSCVVWVVVARRHDNA